MSVNRPQDILSLFDWVEVCEPFPHYQALIDLVGRIHANNPVDALVLSMNWVVADAARAAAELGIPFTSFEGVENCCDKFVARQKLETAGLAVGKFALVSTLEMALAEVRRIGYPVVCKSSRGAGSLPAKTLYCDAEMRVYWSEIHGVLDQMPLGLDQVVGDKVIMESYLKGKMLSVEMAADLDHVEVLVIAERQRADMNEVFEMGTTMPALVTEAVSAEVAGYAKAAVRALGLDFGIFHFEIMLTRDGPVLIDANPRILGDEGPLLVYLSTGVNLFDLQLMLHLDTSLPKQIEINSRPVCSRLLGSTHEHRMTHSISFPWLADYGEAILANTINLVEGQVIPRYKTNMDNLGYFIVTSDTPESAQSLAAEIFERMAVEVPFETIN